MKLSRLLCLVGTALGCASEARTQPYAFVTYSAANAFSVVDTSTNTLLSTFTPLFSGFPFPSGSGPCGVAVTPDGITAYFTFLNTAPTARTDLNLMAAVNDVTTATTTVGTGASTFGVLASPDGKFIYANGLDSSLNSAIIQIATGPKSFNNKWLIPYSVDFAISPDSKTLYLAEYAGGIVVLDVGTGTQTQIVPGVKVQGLVAAPDDATVYAASFNAGGFQGIMAINGMTGAVTLHAIPPALPGGTITPSGMKLTGNGATIFLSSNGNLIYAIDTTTWATDFVIGLPPATLAVAPLGMAITPDDKTLYVLNNGANMSTLLAFDAGTGIQAASIGLPAAIGNYSGTACGLGIASPPPMVAPPPVTVTPSPVTLYANQSVTLTVGPLQKGDVVAWSLAQGAMGTLSTFTGSSTTYTAPSSIPRLVGAPVTATVTNPMLNTRQGIAAISLLPPISVTVSPVAPILNPLHPGQSQTLSAQVMNALNVAVTWSIPAGAPGSITQAGVFTYSGTPVTQTTPVVVTATSQADKSTADTYTLTLSPGQPPAHPAFFTGEVALSSGVYYLQFPANGNIFGYYTYQSFPWLYHYDLGFEYFVDANDGKQGAFLFDSASGHWFYTSPTFAFPYLYDFTLGALLYYYPDTMKAGHYTTNPRIFYNFATGKILTM